MNAIEYYLKKFRQKYIGRSDLMTATGTSALAVSACGGGSGESDTKGNGFPKSYVAPTTNYVSPTERDPNFEILKPPYSDPYWVASLEMDQWEAHITPMLDGVEPSIKFTFPALPPEYDTFNLTGWEPATEEIKLATRDILQRLENILDVRFSETNDSNGTDVIALSISNQTTSAGFSYFPNNFFEIGMDVFIAKKYSSPSFSSELITNFDYEVLVHEVGHAIGLKHPFEANGSNSMILSALEDNTANTAMSYTENSATFNGTFRPLDWMVLTKFYGVNPTYKSDDDVYEFSNSVGIFIIDGAGVDTIKTDSSVRDAMIDLRPGGHSHLGAKLDFITLANQLTISHGSDIENVVTGPGDDTVIGTELDNVFMTGDGSDRIFAGDVSDKINSGTGADHIDLSESVQSRDTVTLDVPSRDMGVDTLYGFSQGVFGDIFDISQILDTVFEIFPLVISGSAPIANFSGGILRLVGSDVSTASDLSDAFKVGGGLEPLSLVRGATALIISADSQETGEEQSIFYAENSGEEISIIELATLQGNALDIDQWHSDNFSIIF